LRRSRGAWGKSTQDVDVFGALVAWTWRHTLATTASINSDQTQAKCQKKYLQKVRFSVSKENFRPGSRVDLIPRIFTRADAGWIGDQGSLKSIGR
jgi:hypothetical protein